MIVVVADTSGLVAALDETHPAGQVARTWLRDAGTVVISPVLLSELDHVARRVLGPRAAMTAIDVIIDRTRLGRVVLAPTTADTLATAQSVRARHPGLRLDLADAVTVAVAAAYRTNAILTLAQRDFRAITPLTPHAAFRSLPTISSGAGGGRPRRAPPRLPRRR